VNTKQYGFIPSGTVLALLLVATSFLVFAPVASGDLVYSTFIGGPNRESVRDVELDSQGNVVILGQPGYSGFPVTPGAFQYTQPYGGGNDVGVIAKLTPDLSTLLAATYLGYAECGSDSVTDMKDLAVGADDAVTVVGSTWCVTFPTTPDAWHPDHMGWDDGFMVQLSSDLTTLLYGTFMGDDYVFWTGDSVNAVAAAEDGTYFVAGYTGYVDKGSFIYIARLSSDLRTAIDFHQGFFLYDPQALEVSPEAGGVFVVGETDDPAFETTAGAWSETYNGGESDFAVRKYDSAMNLQASTFLGGPGTESAYWIGTTVDDAGNLIIAGNTRSATFPVTSGAWDTTINGSEYDGFVLKMNLVLDTLIASTYIGGTEQDRVRGVTYCPMRGTIALAGFTASDDFPVTPDAFDSSFGGGGGDGFLVEMTGALDDLLYSTFVGGTDYDYFAGLTVDSAGRLVAAGTTESADFPTTIGSFDETHNGNSDFMAMIFELPELTITAGLECAPFSGTVPFATQMTVTLDNLYGGQSRRVAGRIDLALAGSGYFANWRVGTTNLAAGGSFVTTWAQNIPAVDQVIGENLFTLTAEDVTPAPYNQPPYPPSGDLVVKTCSVTAAAP